MLRQSLFFLAITCLSAPLAHAQDKERIKHLLSLDIEELITVSVASKKEETIKEAPSVITVITKDDIKRYGAINLSDILNRVPSLQIYGSPFLPNNPVSIRGQSNQHYPNRILFLINGRPFRDATTGGWITPLLTEFPTSAIEKIEIIRGPGSVLYGTNAFSGVINIVTQTKFHNKTAQLSTTLGSFGRRDVEGSGGYQGKNWHLFGAIKDSYANGWDYSLTAEAGTSGSFDLNSDGNGYFLDAKYKGLSLNIFKGRHEETALGPIIRFPTRPLEVTRTLADIGYEFAISDNWEINLNTTYNDFVLDNSASTGQADNTESNYLGEFSIKGRITDKISTLVGGSFEYYEGEISNVEYHSNRSNAYAQFDYKPYDWLKLVGGLQMNKPRNIDSDFSPRVAAIIFLDDRWTAKLMYGEAFRSAAGVESHINIPNVLTGNSSVKPEKIATTEAQLLFNSYRVNATITAYHSRITDIIGRVPFGGGGLTLDNTGEEIYEGIELEGKKIFDNGLAIEGSLLWQRAENSDDRENPNFTTNIMAKGGVTYESDHGWTIGIFDSYFGDPEDVRAADPSVLEVNPEPKAYHMVTANLNFDIPKLLGKEDVMPDMTFSIFGENLLDEDIYYPEFNRKNVNSIPIEGGRAVYGTLRIKF